MSQHGEFMELESMRELGYADSGALTGNCDTVTRLQPS